jgi:hypothetical protein
MREKYEMYSVLQAANNYGNKVKQSAILMMRLRTEYTQPMTSSFKSSNTLKATRRS